MKRIFMYLINRIPMIIIGIPIICYFYAIYGEPSDKFFEIFNIVSICIIFIPVVLFLIGGLYMTITEGLDKLDDECKCCCKCCCCKGGK